MTRAPRIKVISDANEVELRLLYSHKPYRIFWSLVEAKSFAVAFHEYEVLSVEVYGKTRWFVDASKAGDKSMVNTAFEQAIARQNGRATA